MNQVVSTWIAAPVLPRGRFFVAAGLMLLALLAGKLMQPSRLWAQAIGDPVYATTLPHEFGDWKRSDLGVPAVVNPVQSEMLERIYSETVAASYVQKSTGRLLILSIAYGRNQSSDTQLHTPEMCYGSQGFKVGDSQVAHLTTHWGSLPVRHVPTSMGSRSEPLTYFIRNSRRVTTDSSLSRNLARMEVALRGYVGDGLLVRVSEITPRDDAFALQSRFLTDFLGALTPAQRELYIGNSLAAIPAHP